MISGSDFLLSYLVNAAWQVPALVILTWVGVRLIRGLPASRSHGVWRVALVLAVLLPAAPQFKASPSASVPSIEPPVIATSIAQVEAVPENPVALSPQGSKVTIDVRRDLAGVILAMYAVWIAIRLVRLVAAYIATVRLRERAQPLHASPVLQAVAGRCAAAFGLARVRLLTSTCIQGPVTVGFRAPVILLPSSLCSQSEELLAAAIGHEMAHVSRHDFARNLLHELLLVPISWHPAAAVIARHLRRTRELACDELVRQRVLESKTYARCIVALAETASRASAPQYALGMFDSDDLQARIRRLLSPPVSGVRPVQLMTVASLAAALVLGIAVSGSLFTTRAQSAIAAELKLAETAYNQQDFRSAIQHFRNAVRMEPTDVNAKLFLANALTQAHAAERLRPDDPLLVEARQQYQDVLAYDRNDVRGLQGLVVVNLMARRAQEAHAAAARLLQVNPNDVGVLHMAGVTAWATVFPDYQQMKQASGGRPEEYYVANAHARSEMRTRFLPQIEFGIEKLLHALQIDPQLHESMAYLNLLYRLKSGVANTPAEAAALLAEADTWVGKALTIKRQLGSAPSGTSTKLDVSGAPPGPAKGTMVFAPPPPPPPPPPSAKRIGAVPRAIAPGERFWEVTGKAPMEPMQLYRDLRAKGFHAVLLKTDAEPRVLAGPYGDQQALDDAKTKLDAAGFSPVRMHR